MNPSLKLLFAALIAFGIGFGCRWFKLPVPAPPTLAGVLLVVAITVGYLTADALRGEDTIGQGAPVAEPGN
mgnify:CR=1 FL=1